MARVVVSGYMIRHPVAGNLLAYFHYILGLHRLGHEVFYIEESGWPSSCYDPVRGEYGEDPRAGLQAMQALLAECGIDIPLCFVSRASGAVFGTPWDDAKRMLTAADLLLNLGGTCWLPEFRLCRRRALVDMDPLFTQVGRFSMAELDQYDVHFSYGANIGQPGCTVPTRGIAWVPTVPPVVPEWWALPASRPLPPPESAMPGDGALTTIANWRAYGGITFEGERYGQKQEEFLRILDLPRRTAQRLELALSGTGAGVVQSLRTAGWSVRNAGEVSRDIAAYRAYVAGSRGELSVAKHAYIKTRSGWFSDRSVCYLAAGRPVILQDTGFSDWLPVGRGVFAFRSIEEAADSIEWMNADYAAHRRAAREIAERRFSHSVVLPRLLDFALGIRAPDGFAVAERSAR